MALGIEDDIALVITGELVVTQDMAFEGAVEADDEVPVGKT